MKTFRAIILLVLTIGCSKQETGWKTYGFAGLELDIDVQAARIKPTEGSLEVCDSPASRNPSCFTIDRHNIPALQTSSTRTRTLGTASILFLTSVHSGGSGGEEAKLRGVLTVGNQRFGLTCHAQKEWSHSPSNNWPEWCLERFRFK